MSDLVDLPSGGLEPLPAISKEYNDDDMDDIVHFVSEKSRTYNDRLRDLHRLYAKCEEAYMGVGFTPLMPELPRMYVPLIARHVDVVSGKIQQAVMNSGSLMNYTPKDPSAVDAAKRVTRFMDRVVKSNSSNVRHLRHWIGSSPKLGTSFLRCTIEYANMPIGFDMEDEHDIEDFGRLEVRWKYVSPDRILLDPSILTVEDQPYVIEIDYMTERDLLYRSATGEWDAAKVRKAIKTGSADGLHGRNEINGEHPYYNDSVTDVAEHYKVKYCWFSDGWLFTTINDAVLVEAKKTQHSRENGGSPYIPFFYSVDTGSFFGIPLTWRILSSQKELNDTKALSMAARMHALSPISLVDASKFQNEKEVTHFRPNGVYKVNGDPREAVHTLGMPPGNYQAAQADSDRVYNEAEYLGGVNDTLMGAVTGGRTPATTERLRNANAHSQIDAIVNANVDNIIRLGEISLMQQREIIQLQGSGEYVRDVSSDTFYFVTENDFDAALDVEGGIDINKVSPETSISNLQAWLGTAVQAIQQGVKLNPDLIEKAIRYMGDIMGIPTEYLMGKGDTYMETLGELDEMATTGISANVSKESDHLQHIIVEMQVLQQAVEPQFREAVREHIGRHVFELQKKALKEGIIETPIYATPGLAVDDVGDGQMEIEGALGLNFLPGPMGAMQGAMGMMPEQMPGGAPPMPGGAPQMPGGAPPMPMPAPDMSGM